MNIPGFIQCLSVYMFNFHISTLMDIWIYFYGFRVEQVNKDCVESFFSNHISFMRGTFGILLFLYTVMHSKVNKISYLL